MKLWKRRPLSEDLSKKDFKLPNEMPPSLVYISPGNQRISKRSSLTSTDVFVKFQCPLEINSFQSVESNNNNENEILQRNNYCQSFRDYESKSCNKYDDCTLKSLNSSNKDCKSYLPPVSSEWSPVKDVMKICRSASVPFKSRNTEKVEAQEVRTDQSSNGKSPRISLSDKIKFFFRNRSTSRSSKPTLALISENKSMKSLKDTSNINSRVSRPRMKESERCKSLYEPTQNHEQYSFQKSNQVNKPQHSQNENFDDKRWIKQKISIKEIKNEMKYFQPVKKEKFERKIINSNDNQKRPKIQPINQDPSQRVCIRQFSSSVVSHTTSSAAKCKSTSPKTSDIHPNYHKNIRNIDKQSDRNTPNKFIENTESNSQRKSYKVYDSPDFGKLDASILHKPPQAVIALKPDKKITNFTKSDSLVTRSAWFESKGCKQKTEYLLPNRIVPPVSNNSENRISTNENRKSFNNFDDEDYVTLAEIDMSLTPNSALMSHSFYASALPEYSNFGHRYENNENVHNSQIKTINHNKEIISTKNKPRMAAVGGELRKRPISCMAVMNAECRLTSSDSKNNEKFENLYPKSPYLSQYSKLYSLRTNDFEIIQRYGNELADLDLMTRSQHSGHCRMHGSISKDHTGKLSIDSGLVDDISVFHSDCVQQTQN